MSWSPSGNSTAEPAGIFSEFAYKPADRGVAGTAASGEAAMDTSSGSEEDTAWFKKSTPQNTGGAGAGAGKWAAKPLVKAAKGMASPGWMSKNDPSNLMQREKNVKRAKAQRGQKTGTRKGVKKKQNAAGDSDDDYDDGRRGGSGKGKKAAVARRAARRRGRGGDEDEESEESFESGDDSDDDSEDEFDDDEESSDDDGGDEPDLTDASSGDEGNHDAAEAEAAVASPSIAATAAAATAHPTLATNAAAILVAAATDEEKKKAEAKKAKAKAKKAKAKTKTTTIAKTSKADGTAAAAAVATAGGKDGVAASPGGATAGAAEKEGGVDSGSAGEDLVVVVGNGTVKIKEGGKVEGGRGRSTAGKDSNGGGKGSNGGAQARGESIVIVDDGQDSDDHGVEVVGFKAKAEARGRAAAASDGGGGSKARRRQQQQQPLRPQGKKRRRVVNDSDEDSSSGDEVAVVQVEAAPPSKKKEKEKEMEKKKKKHRKRYDDEDDDGMDDSDRGSDSDEDTGARARKVLSECSKLSTRLAEAISKWTGDEGEERGNGGGTGGAAAARGALEISSLKGGGKTVTTNEEIQEACPGLKLNPYQLVGVNWMCLLREVGVNGVLADEMGLGKTVQTIAFFALLRHRRKGSAPRRPHLVVVPSSVLDNWASELDKFCPALYMVKYHGSQKDRLALRHSLNRVASGHAKEDMPDIVLTTYVIWERESSGDDRSFLKRFHYDYMVLDEGHSIKNIKSSRFQRLRVVNAKHRLLLSGTPVQNNLGELLALLSFLMPQIFRSDVIETLLEFLGDSADSSSSSPSSSSSSFQVREVRGMLAPFVLRRLKADVLQQLVAKTDRLEKVPLSKVQQSLYDGVLENHVRQKKAAIERALAKERELFGSLSAGADTTSNVTRSAGSGSGSGSSTSGGGGCEETAAETGGKGSDSGDGDAVEIVGTGGSRSAGAVRGDGGGEALLEEAGITAKECKNIFTELRKGANHPLMLLNHFKGGGKLEQVVEVLHRTGYFGGQATKDMVIKEVSGYSDFDLHQVCSGYDSLKHLCLSEETLFTSAKMERLKTLLPELVAQGHRILLFSQWTRLLDLLEVLLGGSMGMSFCRLDGSTPVSERKALIDKFGADTTIPVFLLSTRAGGLGINLTAADTVILHDVDFNPENDRQAEDRCHRIGQTKPVTVIRMVAAGTVDEDIYLCGERKKEVNESVLNDSGKKEKDTASTISGILKRAIQVHMQGAA